MSDIIVQTFGSEIIFIRCLAVIIIAIAPIVFLLLQFMPAPYGRYGTPSWGPGINAKLAWFIQELPSFAVPVLLLLFTDCPQLENFANKILVALFLIHYFQRALVFPFLLRGGKDTPLITILMALIFCTCNGYLQARYHLVYAIYPSDWVYQPNFLLGVALFFTGMVINLHSDHILRNLRKVGETGYKIPRGSMFEYVSGANFLGEILEWLGYAVASMSLPATAFAVFTACNISPRALHHHRWYLEKFRGDYPKQRKALIPLIL